MEDVIDAAAKAILNRTSEVDYMLLADRAEVINSKVYLMGGGWDSVTSSTYPHQLMIGIVVGLRVPWSETDAAHQIRVLFKQDEGEAATLFELEAQIDVGRPPGRRGLDMLIPMAFNGPVVFPAPGPYVLTAGVDGHPPRRQVVTAVKQ